MGNGSGRSSAAVEIADRDGGGAMAHQVSGDDVYELRETIKRMKLQIKEGLCRRLSDKGEKFLARLRMLEEELESKENGDYARDEDKTKNLKSQRYNKPRSLVPSQSANSLETSSQPKSSSLLDSCFNQNLGSEADNGQCGTLAGGLQLTGPNMQALKPNEPQIDQNARMLLKPFSSPTIIDTDKNDSSCYSGEHSGGGVYKSTRSSKRRKAWKSQLLQQEGSDEVQAVVLSDEEDELPIQAKQGEEGLHKRMDAKIHYPSRDHPECVEIHYQDIKCLDPCSYLSSTIMNFYIQYLQKSVSPSGRLRSEYHFFNTYFYNKLEKAVSCKVDKSATFSKLRRWLKGINIFQKAYIFVPVHGDMHWSLVIICIPAIEDVSGPIILHLDSLGFHDSTIIFKNIESYLKQEWEHAYKSYSAVDIPVPGKIWDYLPNKIQKKKIMVPQQKNDYDCGLFVLYFMQRFVEEAPERLEKKDLAMFGSKWFQPEEASGLRKRLRKLLMEEFERSGSENITPDSPASSVFSRSNQQHGNS